MKTTINVKEIDNRLNALAIDHRSMNNYIFQLNAELHEQVKRQLYADGNKFGFTTKNYRKLLNKIANIMLNQQLDVLYR